MAHVRKREGKKGLTFTITASMGYDESGQQIRKFTTYKPPAGVTPGKAEKLANEYAVLWEEKIRGYVALDENKTLSELCGWYYDTVAPNTLKPNILDNYRGDIENHVVSRIGREKLKNITPQMLDSVFRDLQVSGNREVSCKLKDKALLDGVNRANLVAKSGVDRVTVYNFLGGKAVRRETGEKVSAALETPFDILFEDATEKKGLSGATVNKIKLNLSAIFTAAVKKEIMRRNPCKLVTPPKVDTPPAAYLDDEQSLKLLDAIRSKGDFQFMVIVNFLIASGARAGECTALHWDDVDLDTGLLHIRHTLVRHRGQFIRQTPKTETSNRHLILPQYVVELLAEHKKRQTEYIKSIGEASLYQGQIFANLRGDYFNSINLNAQLKRAVRGLELPEISLHSLRHTNASLLINSDIPAKVVAGLLGHAQIKTTLDTYSHIFTASEVKAMQAVEMKLFQRKSEAAHEDERL
jgi:integrase